MQFSTLIYSRKIKLFKYRSQILILFYFFLISFTIFKVIENWGYDDPYIIYRYAENISNGVGFVYNPGERVLSTTTPLFAVFLALIAKFGLNIPKAANIISALSLTTGAIFIWSLSNSIKTPFVGWVSLLIYPFFPLLLTTSGSETPLYLLFCIGAIVYYEKGYLSFSAIFAALATLTRPDGILIPLLLLIDYFIIKKQKKIPIKAIGFFFIILLPWIIFAFAYFGSPIPTTLATKQHQGLMDISQKFFPGFIDLLRQYSSKWQYIYSSVFFLIGMIFSFYKSKRWLLFFSWSFLHFINYIFLGVSGYFWYYAPLVPSFVIGIGLGFEAIINHLDPLVREKLFTRKSSFLSFFMLLIFIIPIIILFINSIIYLQKNRDKRLDIYKTVGIWINQNTPKDSKIGVLEVGIIGFYAKRTMVDFAGILYPKVTELIKEDTNYQDVGIWTVEQFNPDYIIFFNSGLFLKIESDYAAKNCKCIKILPGKEYNYDFNLKIFKCDHQT
jgi:arabinofuranosyltransferase